MIRLFAGVLLALMLTVTAGCGDRSGDSQPGRHTEGKPTPASELEPCDTPGARRLTTPSEEAEYCLCEQGRWACYGPDPRGPSAGGARGAERAVCPGPLRQSGSAGCMVMYSSCSDGHAYMLSCLAQCYCLVDSTFTVDLPADSACPETLSDLNRLCGWALENAPNGE